MIIQCLYYHLEGNYTTQCSLQLTAISHCSFVLTLSLNSSSAQYPVFSHLMVTMPPNSIVNVPIKMPTATSQSHTPAWMYIQQPRYITSTGHRSFTFSAPIIWNSVPLSTTPSSPSISRSFLMDWNPPAQADLHVLRTIQEQTELIWVSE